MRPVAAGKYRCLQKNVLCPGFVSNFQFQHCARVLHWMQLLGLAEILQIVWGTSDRSTSYV